MRQNLEAALPAGADPGRHARVLSRVYEAALSGERLPARPRAVIGASWQRMRRMGIDPDKGSGAPALPPEDIESRRQDSGLADALPILRSGLTSVARTPRTSWSWWTPTAGCCGGMEVRRCAARPTDLASWKGFPGTRRR